MNKLCFLDTETSGLDENRHTILQISFIITDCMLNEEFAFTQYIRPYESEIDPEALKINKLYDYASFPSPSIVAQNLKTIFDKYTKEKQLFLCGWNIYFDWIFLKKFGKENNIDIDKYFNYAPIDIRSMVFKDFYLKEDRPSSLHLEDVSKYFGIEHKGDLHNAETDVRLTLEIFKKIK